MDDGIGGVQETSEMSVSSDDDGVKKRRESNAELAHDRAAEAQPDGSLGDPELGISFHTENEVREYYNRYAKAKGFGVTRRSSHRDDDGQLKYLTLCCSRYGKTQSNPGNVLKPNRIAGTGCKAKINITRAPDGRFHLSTVILDHNHALSPFKPRRFRCNKKLDFPVKRRLELNDPAELRANKSSTIPCVTHFDIEKQFQSAYANWKFKEFQEELTQTMYCDRKLTQKEGATETYEITEDMLIDEDKGWRKDIVHHVYFSEEEFEVKCSCRCFEFTGILCRHVLCVLTHKKIKEVPPQYIHDRWKKDVNRKHNFVRCTYGGMEDAPVAKRFDRLCNSFYPVAEIGALSDDSCNVLMEELRTLKIRFSSDSSSENGKEHVATQEDASSNGKTTSKTIPSPIAVRCAGCPPSLRKESMLDKLICRANEKKKKAEQKACSTNLNKKRSRKNRKSCEEHAMEHASQQPVCLDDPGCNSRAQAPFNLGITTGDINPTVTATIPSGGSSTTVMPLIIGEYTGMPFQVQQGRAIVPSCAELHFDGIGGFNNTVNLS
ncbi:transposon unclassified [Hordeum vulgare]|nr:transposon unclassified [Hordeum vulgare]